MTNQPSSVMEEEEHHGYVVFPTQNHARTKSRMEISEGSSTPSMMDDSVSSCSTVSTLSFSMIDVQEPQKIINACTLSSRSNREDNEIVGKHYISGSCQQPVLDERMVDDILPPKPLNFHIPNPIKSPISPIPQSPEHRQFQDPCVSDFARNTNTTPPFRRTRGTNYCREEIKHLLDAIEEIRPKDFSQWDAVRRLHCSKWPYKNRPVSSLKKKFRDICNFDLVKAVTSPSPSGKNREVSIPLTISTSTDSNEADDNHFSIVGKIRKIDVLRARRIRDSLDTSIWRKLAVLKHELEAAHHKHQVQVRNYIPQSSDLGLIIDDEILKCNPDLATNNRFHTIYGPLCNIPIIPPPMPTEIPLVGSSTPDMAEECSGDNNAKKSTSSLCRLEKASVSLLKSCKITGIPRTCTFIDLQSIHVPLQVPNPLDNPITTKIQPKHLSQVTPNMEIPHVIQIPHSSLAESGFPNYWNSTSNVANDSLDDISELGLDDDYLQDDDYPMGDDHQGRVKTIPMNKQTSQQIKNPNNAIPVKSPIRQVSKQDLLHDLVPEKTEHHESKLNLLVPQTTTFLGGDHAYPALVTPSVH